MTASSASLRILAFEPFDAGSHRAVRESISRHSRHRWTWLTRPGRSWKWRMRLAAMELVDQAREAGEFERPIDLVFLTSLMSAADLRAMLPPGLRDLPVVLYMHENQAAYPAGENTRQQVRQWDAHFALTNLTSILAADAVIWNSRWNLRSFVDGISILLTRAADCQFLGNGKSTDLAMRIESRSQVIWPPVEPPDHGAEANSAGAGEGESVARPAAILHNTPEPIRVVWPHRWEHDKGPDELLDLANTHSEDLNLRWTILGQEFEDRHPAMVEFARRHAGRIDHMGFVPERADYWRHLHRCDWVLSTAQHEFFGIAVVEAMLAGCLPWLPSRLSYPEIVPQAALDLSPLNPPEAPKAIQEAIVSHLQPSLAPRSISRLDTALAGQADSGERPSA